MPLPAERSSPRAWHASLGLVPAGLGLALMMLAMPGRAGAADVDFARDVLPILADRCFTCHGPDPAARKADLRLDVKEAALAVLVPGQADESELIARITSADPDEVMPPPKTGKSVTPEEATILRRWIDAGAKWGKHWAFEPVRRPEPPAVAEAHRGRVRNPIDAFVLERLEREGLEPAPEADRATLIRRLSLDLIGLPPTPSEVDAFLADQAPDAYEKVIDRLLASPHYGERMAMDWLDGARYADTNGYQNDFARTMWPWRDWVVEAFNRNLPYDRFLTEQLAGDLLPGPTRAQRVATGFNRNNRTVTEAGSIDEEWRIENAIDRVETTATVFLGLTLGCARCHDHKYDPVSQEEFYRFLGVFNSVNEKGVYTETRGNVPPLIAVPGPEQEERLGVLAAAVAAAEKAAAAWEAELPAAQGRWEADQRSRPEPKEPTDWSVRIPLDGSLALDGPDVKGRTGVDRAEGGLAYVDGPTGRALKLDGKGGHAEAWPAAAPDRGDAFTYGAWVRRRGEGAVLSKMDDGAAFRGFDLLVNAEGKLEVHLVHAWPGDALKVVTRRALPAGGWAHALVTFDGSGKAAGLAIYLDGRRAEVDVQADTLTGSIANDQPLRIGRRSSSSPLDGDVADARLYRRALTAEEARTVADHPALLAARRLPDAYNAVQSELVARLFRERFAPGHRAATEAVEKARVAKEEYEKAIPTVMVMEDTPTPRPTYLLKRGRYDMPDTSRTLEPGVPACLPPLPSDAPANRLGLARWLAAPEHPLTARVAANRAWQHHFGVGLVATAENFGLQGEAPSHPALLDWLAAEFVASGWDLKALHKLIVTSATYRQSSRAEADLVARDPENRLLARGPRHRLPAELVRDNALRIAGLLNPALGGPPVKPYQPEGLWEELAGGAGEGPYVRSSGPDLYRRSLYIYRKRTVPHPALATFDAPSREVCQVRRPRTDTPLQALALLNDVTYVEAARGLAQRMLTEGGPTAKGRVAHGFRLATARRPTDRELGILVAGLDDHRRRFVDDRAAAEALVRQGESPVPSGLDPSELAAYLSTAGVILNLDETLTLE